MKKPIAILALLLGAAANAEIYEIIDEHGRKSYTNKPPHDQPDARPIGNSPKSANQWDKDPLQEQNERYFEELKARQEEQEKAKADLEARKEEEARQQEMEIEAAEELLEEAKELKAGDYFINKNQKGMRYTQEYRDRVEEAEDNLEKVKERGADDETGED